MSEMDATSGTSGETTEKPSDQADLSQATADKPTDSKSPEIKAFDIASLVLRLFWMIPTFLGDRVEHPATSEGGRWTS